MSFTAWALPLILALSVAYALYRVLFKDRHDLWDCLSSLLRSLLRSLFFNHSSRAELRDHAEQMKLLILVGVSAMAGLIARAIVIGFQSGGH
jgi:hypothetical protein